MDLHSRRIRLVGLLGIGALFAALIPMASALAISASDFSVSSPATGGANIPSTKAGGAWTTLTGPSISVKPSQTADLIMPAVPLVLSLPGNFEFNPAITTAPKISSGCQLTATTITYSGAGNKPLVAQVGIAGTHNASPCTIAFGDLEVRPISASGGTGGDMTVSADGVHIGNGGVVSMTVTPPTGQLHLTITSPTANNSAIIWGESYIDVRTQGTPGTKFEIQASSDNATWVPIKDSAGTPYTFTIGSNGSSVFRYTPIRNYWYKSVAGSTVSNVVRWTVRETITLRPTHSGVATLSAGTAITFNGIVRPTGPNLPRANVLFQIWQKTSSGTWALHTSYTKASDVDGNTYWTVTWSTKGEFYIRAQSQPTSVNANSFWSPNEYYTIK